jgi:hypothetical protein
MDLVQRDSGVTCGSLGTRPVGFQRGFVPEKAILVVHLEARKLRPYGCLGRDVVDSSEYA